MADREQRKALIRHCWPDTLSDEIRYPTIRREPIRGKKQGE